MRKVFLGFLVILGLFFVACEDKQEIKSNDYQKLSLSDIESKNLSVDTEQLVYYLNQIEDLSCQSESLDSFVESMGDPSNNLELYLSKLLYEDANNLFVEYDSNNLKSINGLKWKRIVCYWIGVAKWTACDDNCQNCSGVTWAGCNSYPQECN